MCCCSWEELSTGGLVYTRDKREGATSPSLEAFAFEVAAAGQVVQPRMAVTITPSLGE